MTVPYPARSLRECAEIPDRSRQPTQSVTSRGVLWPSRWRTLISFTPLSHSIAMSISDSIDHSRSDTPAVMAGVTAHPCATARVRSIGAYPRSARDPRHRDAGEKFGETACSRQERGFSGVLRIAQCPAIGAIVLIAPENPQRSGLVGWPTAALPLRIESPSEAQIGSLSKNV